MSGKLQISVYACFMKIIILTIINRFYKYPAKKVQLGGFVICVFYFGTALIEVVLNCSLRAKECYLLKHAQTEVHTDTFFKIFIC